MIGPETQKLIDGYTRAWNEHHPDQDTVAMWSCDQCEMVARAYAILST